MEIFSRLLIALDALLARKVPRAQTLQAVCELLHAEVPHYNWVGFYLVDSAKEDELVLGPYVGAATDHVRIPFGSGICGQAAARRQTFVVQDVSQETNYLSCSAHVKSEIVVPLLNAGRVVGELDIDSHTLAPFTEADRVFLERVGKRICTLFGSSGEKTLETK